MSETADLESIARRIEVSARSVHALTELCRCPRQRVGVLRLRRGPIRHTDHCRHVGESRDVMLELAQAVRLGDSAAMTAARSRLSMVTKALRAS